MCVRDARESRGAPFRSFLSPASRSPGLMVPMPRPGAVRKLGAHLTANLLRCACVPLTAAQVEWWIQQPASWVRARGLCGPLFYGAAAGVRSTVMRVSFSAICYVLLSTLVLVRIYFVEESPLCCTTTQQRRRPGDIKAAAGYGKNGWIPVSSSRNRGASRQVATSAGPEGNRQF